MDLLLEILKIVILIVIFILAIATVLVIPRVKETKNNTIKTLLYLFLGLVAFALAGISYTLNQPIQPPDDPTIYVRNIIEPYIQFFPIFIYSIALIAVTLVTYMDKDKYGYIIAGTGFAVLLPELYNYILNGRYDLILLGFALWALIPVIWVTMWKNRIYDQLKLKDKFLTSLKAAILTYPIYILTALVSVFGETGLSLDPSVLNKSTLYGDVALFILGTLWLYLLINVIIVTLMFVIHDLALHTFNIKREVTDKNEILYYREKEKEEVVAEQPKPDMYKGLLDEMQVFYRYLDRVDRIRAASTIARFKSEYQTLAVRYSDGSRVEAEQFIKLLDQEFKKRF